MMQEQTYHRVLDIGVHALAVSGDSDLAADIR